MRVHISRVALWGKGAVGGEPQRISVSKMRHQLQLDQLALGGVIANHGKADQADELRIVPRPIGGFVEKPAAKRILQIAVQVGRKRHGRARQIGHMGTSIGVGAGGDAKAKRGRNQETRCLFMGKTIDVGMGEVFRHWPWITRKICAALAGRCGCVKARAVPLAPAL